MGDLYRADGRLFNGSASQRQIARLEEQNHHLRTHLAVIVARSGGSVVVPIEEMRLTYDISANASEDGTEITWTSVVHPPNPVT